MELHRKFRKSCCEDCGNHLEKDLLVHHIDLNKKNNSPLNLKTLCRKCHGLIHRGGNIRKGQSNVFSLRFRNKEELSLARNVKLKAMREGLYLRDITFKGFEEYLAGRLKVWNRPKRPVDKM